MLRKSCQRTLSFALALSMLFALFPVQAFAEKRTESALEAASDSEMADAEQRETDFLPAEPMETESEANTEIHDSGQFDAIVRTDDGVTDALEQNAEMERFGDNVAAESSLQTADNVPVKTLSGDDSPEIIASGECGANGNNVTWTLDADGLLTFSGTGKIKEHSNYDTSFQDLRGLEGIKSQRFQEVEETGSVFAKFGTPR